MRCSYIATLMRRLGSVGPEGRTTGVNIGEGLGSGRRGVLRVGIWVEDGVSLSGIDEAFGQEFEHYFSQ